MDVHIPWLRALFRKCFYVECRSDTQSCALECLPLGNMLLEGSILPFPCDFKTISSTCEACQSGCEGSHVKSGSNLKS